MKKTKLLICIVLVGIFGQNQEAEAKAAPKPHKTFVLVHGAWQAEFAWEQVAADLKKEGNAVIVVNLPGHGDDNTAPEKVSMNAYRDKVIAAVNHVSEKVILVGHSMGGMVISAVAEKIPAKIGSLFYLGAFLPGNGDSLMSLTMQDKQSILGAAIVPSADHLTLDVQKDKVISIFCQDADQQTQKMVLARFKIEFAIPFGDAVTLSDSNFGNVKKYYIYTLLDRAVGIDLQHKMVAAATVQKEFSVNSGHSPHITQPHAVSKILLQIAK